MNKKIFFILTIPISIVFGLFLSIAYAHVGISSSPSTSCGSIDSTNFKTHVQNQIDNRLVGQSTTTAWNIYSTRGDSVTTTAPTSTPWVRNTSLWTNVGTDIDFTGISAWTQMYDGYSSRYQHVATLISPRHFVTANHWGINNNATLAFITNDNTIVYRTVLNTVQVGTSDIQVGILDSDVPDSVTYYPIMASSTLESVAGSYVNEAPDFPVVTFDSHNQRASVSRITAIASGQFKSASHSPYTTGKKQEFASSVISGDSGNPAFIIVDNVPVLLFTHTTSNGGPQHGAYINEINSAMASLGGSYQVTQYDPTCFDLFTRNTRPTIQKTFPTYTPQVTNPAVSTTTPFLTFVGNDADSGDVITLSIEQVTASGTTSPIVASDLFTIATTSNSMSLTQKINISENVYGNYLTIVAKVTDNSSSPASATTTVVVSVRNATQGEKKVYQEDFSALNFIDGQGTTLYDNGTQLFYAGQMSQTNYGYGNLGLVDMSGNLNTTFATNAGIGTRDASNTRVYTNDIDKDASGRFLIGANALVVSYAGSALTQSSPLIRLNSDGIYDNTFLVNMGTSASTKIYGMATMGDSVFVTGTFTTVNGTSIKRIALINSDGTLNSTFATNYGTGSAGLSGSIVTAGSVIYDGQSSIYVSGVSTSYVSPTGSTTSIGRIAKFNINGTFDTSFATNSGTGFNAVVLELKMRPDGKLVALGNFSSYNGTTVNKVAVINPDGTLDTTFATNVGTGISSNMAFNFVGMDVQADNKVLLGSSVTAFNGQTTGLFLRLNSDGSLDTDFMNSIGLGMPNGQISEVLTRTDGSVVLGVGGSALFDTYPATESVVYLKTIPPSAPIISTIYGLDNSSTVYANSNTVAFSGTGSSTALITIFDGLTAIATTTVDSHGVWNATTTLTEGSHTINTIQSLRVLNTATSSTSTAQVVVDITPPAAPTITSPVAGQNIGLTGSITGTCEAGSVVIDSNSYLVANNATTTCSGGAYSFNVEWNLNAIHTTQVISISAYDLAGNSSATTSVSAEVIGLSNAPTNLTLVTGRTDTTPSFTVSCDTGATVYVYENTTQLASATCVSDTATLVSSELSVGTHTVIAVQNGVSGLSAASSILTFELGNATETVASSGGGSSGGGSQPTGYVTPLISGANQKTNSLIQFSFTKPLTVGSTGNEVFMLQKYLNSIGFTVSQSGAGSPGKENTYFGVKTKNALKRFQQSVGIVPATGYFGEKTKAYLVLKNVAQGIGQKVSSSTALSNYPDFCTKEIYLKSPVKFGGNNNPEDVKILQYFLNRYEGTALVADGVYDRVDYTAVVAFQEKYRKDILDPWGILKGTGYVYTTSLKKIREIVATGCK